MGAIFLNFLNSSCSFQSQPLPLSIYNMFEKQPNHHYRIQGLPLEMPYIRAGACCISSSYKLGLLLLFDKW